MEAIEAGKAAAQADRLEQFYIKDVNELLHSIHGGGPDHVTKRKQVLRKMIASREHSLMEAGLLIHAFGDSYAHTYAYPNTMGARGHEYVPVNKVRGERYAYAWPDGHALTLDEGHAPDMIPYDYDNYERYVNDLLSTLAERRGEELQPAQTQAAQKFMRMVREQVTAKGDGGARARTQMSGVARAMGKFSLQLPLFPEASERFRIKDHDFPTRQDIEPLMDSIYEQHFGREAWLKREAERYRLQ